jgi:hypothetical protein
MIKTPLITQKVASLSKKPPTNSQMLLVAPGGVSLTEDSILKEVDVTMPTLPTGVSVEPEITSLPLFPLRISSPKVSLPESSHKFYPFQ